MVTALSYAGYDCAHIFGEGGHSRRHGGACGGVAGRLVVRLVVCAQALPPGVTVDLLAARLVACARLGRGLQPVDVALSRLLVLEGSIPAGV